MIRKALIAVALVLPGCAQVPMADPQADQTAKAFPTPEPGRGALYVYRTGYMGIARSIDVQVVGGRTAQLASNTYLRLEGPPGPIEVDCKVGDKTGALKLYRRALELDPELEDASRKANELTRSVEGRDI